MMATSFHQRSSLFSQAQLNTSLVVDELCLRWYMVASAMPAMHSFYGTEENGRLPHDLVGSYRSGKSNAIKSDLPIIEMMLASL